MAEMEKDDRIVLMIALREKREKLTKEMGIVDRLLIDIGGTFGEYELAPAKNTTMHGETLSLIMQVMNDHGDWMSPSEIRDRIAEKLDRPLHKNTLRLYLTTNEDSLFVRRGEKRGTHWKVADAVKT